MPRAMRSGRLARACIRMTPAGSPCGTITAHRKHDTSAICRNSAIRRTRESRVPPEWLVRSNRAHDGEFGCVRPTKYDRLIECDAPRW